MKYSEAEKQIKALSSKYDIRMGDGDFNVVYNGGSYGIYVNDSYEYDLRVEDNITFSKLPFSNKLYMILAELAITPLDKRAEEKKHYVKVFNNEFSYLNINILTGKVTTDNKTEMKSMKTKFTNKEIEQLKQRDDIPLDWDKVELEEADEN